MGDLADLRWAAQTLDMLGGKIALCAVSARRQQLVCISACGLGFELLDGHKHKQNSPHHEQKQQRMIGICV